MGIYNTFGKTAIQLKVGECFLTHYKVGDKIKIPDGIYIAYEGVVIIKISKIIAAYEPDLFDKWGNPIDIDELLNNKSPLINALKSINPHFKKQ
jgi:hypothetical protein